MNLPFRLVMSLIFVGVLLFCIYGILCTFEPGTIASKIAFRLIYGAAAIGSVAGLLKVNRR